MHTDSPRYKTLAMGMRILALALVLLQFTAQTAYGAETTWRHPGFEVMLFDINFTGFDAHKATNYTTIDGKNLSASESSYSYIIVNESGTARDCGTAVAACIKAINGSTWVPQFSSTNFSLVFENASNTAASSGGGEILIKSGFYESVISNAVPSLVTVGGNGNSTVVNASYPDTYTPPVSMMGADYPPVFYNKNYSNRSYNADTRVIIKNMQLRGRAGLAPQRSIPIRLGGCTNCEVSDVYINNLANTVNGTSNGMSQAAISIDRYNINNNIRNVEVNGGWAGIYLASPNENFPEFPNVSNGGNIGTKLTGLNITVGGFSNPIAPGFSINTVLTDSSLYNTEDYCIDIERMDGFIVSNVNCVGQKTPNAGTVMYGGVHPNRNIIVSNMVWSNFRIGITFTKNLQNATFTNIVTDNINGSVITQESPPPNIVRFIGGDLSGNGSVVLAPGQTRTNVTFFEVGGVNDTMVRVGITTEQPLPLVTNTQVHLNNVIFDTMGDFNTTNFTFIAPVTGYYDVSFAIRYNSSVIGNTTYITQVFKNGATTTTEVRTSFSVQDFQSVTGADTTFLNQGETLALRTQTVVNGQGISTDPAATFFNVKLVR